MGTRVLSIVLSLVLFLPTGRAAEPPNAAGQSDAIAASVAASATESGVINVAHPEKLPSVTETAAAQPLSEEEEATLMARAEEPGPEVAGGALSNLHLTYAVIALAAIVLVLVFK